MFHSYGKTDSVQTLYGNMFFHIFGKHRFAPTYSQIIT